MAKNKMLEWTVKRLYRCLECKGEVLFEEKVSQDFTKECPLCGKEELILESGDCGLMVVMDLSQPKTLGSLGQKNYEEAKKNNTLPAAFTKKKNNIDFRILKNPGKFIQTGVKG